MKTLEVEAPTTKAAIAKALKLLGTTRDRVTIKILAEEERGLFGMKGAAQAKVRVTLKP